MSGGGDFEGKQTGEEVYPGHLWVGLHALKGDKNPLKGQKILGGLNVRVKLVK